MNNNTTTPKASAPETRAHSPLPWKIINGAIFDSAGRLVYASEEANGKIIVASVNHADKLAEACRTALFGLYDYKDLCITAEHQRDQIQSALAAYEEAQQ